MDAKKQICPECGSDEIYYARGVGSNWMQTGNATNHILISQGFTPLRAAVDTYVCAGCGYVRTFISKQQDLEKITSNWNPVNK
jgi:hypothetical protein